MEGVTFTATVFLISPANLGGKRGKLRCVSANEELEYASIQAPLTKSSRSAL